MFDPEEMKKSIEVCEAIYENCKRRVVDFRQRGAFEQAASWAWLAAFIAGPGGFIGRLADPDLENELLEIGRTLPAVRYNPKADERLRYLHVLTEVFETGGHSRLCQRWVQADSPRHRHSVVLTAQISPIPDTFKNAVLNLGGGVTVFDPAKSLLHRAAKLRKIACEEADVVVLHTHAYDVTPILAFAVNDTPPVTYMNQAAHLFWLGGSVTDLVFEYARCTMPYTKRFRGMDNSALLPLPLDNSDQLEGLTERSSSSSARASAREILGIPDDAVVFLTIGTVYKYRPIGDYGFLTAASAILEHLPQAYILAVGPKDEGDWASLGANTGGRLKAFGERPDLREFYSAADIYLDGFPLGGGTTILEAGLKGMPCVRKPLIPIQLWDFDDASLSHLASPADMGSYIAEALRLGQASDAARKREGALLRKSIIEHHCGEGWLHYLLAAEARIPERHSIQVREAQRIPSEESCIAMAFCCAALKINGWGDFLKHLWGAAKYRKVCVPFECDAELRRRITAAARKGRTGTSRRTGELYDFLRAEAWLACEADAVWRVRGNWIVCLMMAPLEKGNLGLTWLVLRTFLGVKIAESLRKVKRRVARVPLPMA